MKEKVNRLAVLTKGIIKENPNLVLLLGTCPTLATTSSAFNGMGMGIAATAVLICSKIVISLLAKIIPDKVRIPCYIVVIAGFVTLVQFIVQAFAEPLYNSPRRIPAADRSKLHHSGQSRNVRKQERRAGFRIRRRRHGSWFHPFPDLHRCSQRDHRQRYDLLRILPGK